MEFQNLPKLSPGDKVAIISPSFAAPAVWPEVYELGLQRIRDVFGLEPVSFPATAVLGASTSQRAEDLISAFEREDIKAVIASLGGNDQVTYIKNLPTSPFVDNPKPFFGYSDNTHFANHLWLLGVPSYYGGHLFTEFAMQCEMDPFTVQYLKHALFGGGMVELNQSPLFNDIGLDWSDTTLINQKRRYETNEEWVWNGDQPGVGITWGGCLESVDELLRHGVSIPSLEQFSSTVIFLETSEEIPSAAYVRRVLRALGERGILERCHGLLMGRPKTWEFDKPLTDRERAEYKNEQQTAVIDTVRKYNQSIPIVQNVDFGHTAPQICLPFGRLARIDSQEQKIWVDF